MKGRERSFFHRDAGGLFLMLVSAGSVRVATQRAGGMLFWHGPQGFTDRVSRLLPRRMRSRQGLLLVGLGCETADERTKELLWRRDSPDDPVSISELRSIKRELMIRGRERLRRERGPLSYRTYLSSRIDAFLLDEKRVLNPVGFRGRVLVVEATHLYIDAEIARLLEEVRDAAPRLKTRAFLLDRLAAQATEWTAAGVKVLVGQGGTAVWARNGKRSVLAIGEEAIFRYLLNSGRGVRDAEVRQYRSLVREKGHRSRELTTLALPAMRRWARGIEALLLESIRDDAAPEIPVMFAHTVPIPFSHIFKPQVRRHVFHRLPKARWMSATLPELLHRADCLSVDEAYAALLLRAHRQDRSMMNWT